MRVHLHHVVLFWWTIRDSNPRPLRCERSALPTELIARFTALPFSHAGRAGGEGEI